VGIEVIEDPVIAGHLWQLGDHHVQMAAKSSLVRVMPRFQSTWPVGTTKEARNARTPWRMYSCSRFSAGRLANGVGYFRWSICIPVFSSTQMTKRPSGSNGRR